MSVPRRSLAFVVALVAAVFCSTLAYAIDNPSYALTPWRYGAIAWVGGVPDDYQTLSSVITDALTSVFDFWNTPLPDPMEGWQDPSQVEPAWKTGQVTGTIPQIVKKNPATKQLWRLNPLQWDGMPTYPMVFIAFPDRSLMAQAFGTIMTGGVFITGRSVLPGSQMWFVQMSSVPMSIAAPFVDGTIVSWHEFAHWMTYLLCLRSHVDPGQLPDFIVEGLAEYTAASLVGVAGWNRFASVWAQDHDLDVQVDPLYAYAVGASVIQYLVDGVGKSMFLRNLPLWATEPEAMINSYEDGWRAWLNEQ